MKEAIQQQLADVVRNIAYECIGNLQVKSGGKFSFSVDKASSDQYRQDPFTSSLHFVRPGLFADQPYFDISFRPLIYGQHHGGSVHDKISGHFGIEVNLWRGVKSPVYQLYRIGTRSIVMPGVYTYLGGGMGCTSRSGKDASFIVTRNVNIPNGVLRTKGMTRKQVDERLGETGADDYETIRTEYEGFGMPSKTIRVGVSNNSKGSCEANELEKAKAEIFEQLGRYFGIVRDKWETELEGYRKQYQELLSGRTRRTGIALNPYYSLYYKLPYDKSTSERVVKMIEGGDYLSARSSIDSARAWLLEGHCLDWFALEQLRKLEPLDGRLHDGIIGEIEPLERIFEEGDYLTVAKRLHRIMTYDSDSGRTAVSGQDTETDYRIRSLERRLATMFSEKLTVLERDISAETMDAIEAQKRYEEEIVPYVSGRSILAYHPWFYNRLFNTGDLVRTARKVSPQMRLETGSKTVKPRESLGYKVKRYLFMDVGKLVNKLFH